VLLLLVACTGSRYPGSLLSRLISSLLSIAISIYLQVYNLLPISSPSQTPQTSLENGSVACRREYAALHPTNPTYIPEPRPPPCQSGSRPPPEWATEPHPCSPPLVLTLTQSYRESHILFLLKSACQHRPASPLSAREPTPETSCVWNRALKR
jgi:hypothetical protein